MPQVTNRSLLRDKYSCPMGQGTVYSALLDISATTRERAAKANEGEIKRLQKLTRFIDKGCRTAESTQSRVIDRMSKHLKELQAFKKVVQDDYKISKFQTLRNSDPDLVPTRRLTVETRYYHSGFDMKSLKPEITRKMKLMDPERKRRKMKQQILEASRRETSMLSKTHLTTSAMLNNLRARRCQVDLDFDNLPIICK
ncbi:uncharacterized protein LOC124112685 [Haliotis rufescens]|uniref:uncharacterized protein LOC124112685 n=1 Tax=Haliotis rufescens TaxID=6454 RepID=UPI001EB02A25|nr:uncharacterized protein LOC124112685 [Haliotis rufescens]